MVNHFYDPQQDGTRCGEYRCRLAWYISANYAVSCPQCRDALTANERKDQRYPFDEEQP